MSDSTPASDLTCKELVELITDYLEQALSVDDLRRFEAHLGICAGCNIYLEQMRQTVSRVGRIDETSLSPDAERTLMEAFRDWKSGRT